MHFIPLQLSGRTMTLPLLPLREERAGEKRQFSLKPLSPALSPLIPRGEREKTAFTSRFSWSSAVKCIAKFGNSGFLLAFVICHSDFDLSGCSAAPGAAPGSNLRLPPCAIFVTHGPHALTHSASRVFLLARLGSPR